MPPPSIGPYDLARFEDEDLVSGGGRFTDDITVPGMLHAAFVRSPHANAELRSIDVAAASAMPGVAAILTGEDVAADRLGTIPPLVARPRPDGSAMWVPPRPPLSTGQARFVGDPVALAVADTRNRALDAAEAVDPQWRPLPAVVDLEAAVRPGAPRVWNSLPDNACFAWDAGDPAAVAAAFSRAAHATTVTVRISRVSANPLEPRAAIAWYDPGEDRYTLISGIQSPWQVRRLLATNVFGMAEDRLRVISPDSGGSFGMKGQTYPEFAALLWAARKVGRPLKWVASRSESLLADDHGRDVVLTGALALDADGRILGLRVEGLSALGAYLSTRGTLTAVDNVPGVAGVYRVPAMHARMTGVHTNTGSISPYRGAGRPEASLLIERLMDAAAVETGRDRVELRRLNTIGPNELPWRTPLGFVYDSGDFPAMLDKALALADWAGFASRRRRSEAAGRLRGIGLANVIARAMAGQFEAASARLNRDGRIEVTCGAVSNGQGHATIFRHVAAEALGTRPDRIDYRSGDSDYFDRAVGSFGSRSAGIGGAAVRKAALDLLERARAAAARRMNAAKDSIEYRDETFTAPDGATLSLRDLAEREPDPIRAEATYAPDAPTFPNGCHVCEVEIDPETGATRIDRYAVVEDVGTELNPAAVKGQIHGGVAQGAGQILFEQMVYDPDSGQVLTGSFADYAMPRADDLPSFSVASHPCPTAANPLGVKGGGEGGTIGALPAVLNAICDALRPLGIREVPMPATPPVIWRLIRDARADRA